MVADDSAAGTPADGPADRPRFVADAMLGRLARWLRLVGCDTVYDPALPDRALAALAAREGRVLLTRDHALLARRIVRRGLFVESEQLGPQLRQVLGAFGIVAARELLFTICTVCNGALVPVGRDDVAGRVPPFVLRTHERFLACAGCGRVFWGGTHVDLALADLARLLGEGDSGPNAGPA